MSQLIHEWKPWERSTGPGTAEGKVSVLRKVWNGGVRRVVRQLARLLQQMR